MTFKRASQYLCSFHTQPDAIVLDSGDRCLRNAREFGKLVLTQPLQLTNDAHRLAD